MSAFRVTAGRQGISVPARPLAKLKTLAQDLAVAGAFFPPIGQNHRGVVTIVLWVAVALTLVTGLEYSSTPGVICATVSPPAKRRARRERGSRVRAEIVAVGSELLLGQITDTNSTWIAERLAASGSTAHYQTRVGDNVARIAEVLGSRSFGPMQSSSAEDWDRHRTTSPGRRSPR